MAETTPIVPEPTRLVRGRLLRVACATPPHQPPSYGEPVRFRTRKLMHHHVTNRGGWGGQLGVNLLARRSWYERVRATHCMTSPKWDLAGSDGVWLLALLWMRGA